MKIYLLKKEEEEDKYFFSVKKHIFLPSGKYLEILGTLRYPGRGDRENVGLLEKAWSEDAANLVGKTN